MLYDGLLYIIYDGYHNENIAYDGPTSVGIDNLRIPQYRYLSNASFTKNPNYTGRTINLSNIKEIYKKIHKHPKAFAGGSLKLEYVDPLKTLINKTKMEVKELVDVFVHENLIEVHFRMMNDDDDVIRVDEFEFGVFDDYGYPVLIDEQTIFEYDDENDSFDLDFLDVDVNEQELISFMNEYYIVTGDLPKPEFF
mgnify:CR=1 FL=1